MRRRGKIQSSEKRMAQRSILEEIMRRRSMLEKRGETGKYAVRGRREAAQQLIKTQR